MTFNFTKIRCPYCSAEYVPSELFIPNVFFGDPGLVDKDENTGKIYDVTGDDMKLDTTYTCDYCDHKFKVKAKVSFDAYLDTDKPEDKIYVKESLF